MALMERVATLLRANVNDLIDRAEDPKRCSSSCCSIWKTSYSR